MVDEKKWLAYDKAEEPYWLRRDSPDIRLWECGDGVFKPCDNFVAFPPFNVFHVCLPILHQPPSH
jgi:hypothetical protein